MSIYTVLRKKKKKTKLCVLVPEKAEESCEVKVL